MNILVDWIGHADLYYSIHLLFEQRLGHKLYRPSPTDPKWAALKVQTTTLADYCTTKYIDEDTNLIDMSWYKYQQEAISFRKFLELDIDIVLSTSWGNEVALDQIQRRYKPEAKFILHIANIHETPQVAKNVMLSTLTTMPPGTNSIKYLPEHRKTFSPSLVTPERSINAFYNNMPVYIPEYNQFREAEKSLPEYSFKSYGMNNPDGSVPGEVLPKAMQDSMFIWHTKPLGCCGYTARQALACGKPLVVNKVHARNHMTLASLYLEDSINCIDLSVHSLPEAIELIKSWTENYSEVTKQVTNSVERHMNFSEEALKIGAWLECL